MLWLRVKQIFFSAITLAATGVIFWRVTHYFIKAFKYCDRFLFEIFPVAIAVVSILFAVFVVLRYIWTEYPNT